MKVTLAMIATLAVGALAAPAPEAAPEPWCVRHGEPCGKKREAAPEPWCVRHGEPCGKKREALPEPAPWCVRHGEPCGKKRDVFERGFEDMAPESSAGKLKRAAYALAQTIDTTHLQAREASPEAELSNLPGGAAFMAKRGVNELATLIALTSRNPSDVYEEYNMERNFDADTQIAKREAAPEATELTVAADKRWCASEGQACAYAKRAAEAVLEVIGDHHSLLARAPFDPEWAVKRNPEPWCVRHGEPCGRKRSAEAEAEADPWCVRSLQPAPHLHENNCNKIKRDVASVQNAARSLLASLE